ncbi:Mannan endo-1,6-alpha-mannosidase DCW1-like protein 1 [Elsinoe fawcettii]|nr:Mannan endo-1,6-alpha-mannosidase DCW1-like protein 1 [Elsinoe fawcettii]
MATHATSVYRWLVAGLAAINAVTAITLDINDPQSLKNAASTAAWKMVTFYPGNKTGGIPGLLGDPYYWWETGAMFGSLIDYWHYTGDSSYNKITSEAMLFQIGDDKDYEPVNQTRALGNDDQAFWGIAAMRAAEVNYPNPPAGNPGWLALAQAVFNRQAGRWDTQFCGGGLKWQIFPMNNGYNYKNSISNGLFFNIAARLYAYTGNQTYADWAIRTWDWTVEIGLMNGFNIYDGSDDTINCTKQDHVQWTYNAGVYMYGAATMWNASGTNSSLTEEWKARTIGLWNVSTQIFFAGDNKDILYEVACEPIGNCKTDQLSFKGYLSRWAAVTMQVAPFMTELIRPYLEASAKAAAQNCVGGSDGTTCGTKWYESGWDGSTGVGQQMCALETFQSLLHTTTPGPLSNKTGGTSVGDPTAGSGNDISPVDVGMSRKITTGDKAGAAILTIILLVFTIGGGYFMMTAE